MHTDFDDPEFDGVREERLARMRDQYAGLLSEVGEDPSRDGLLKTPERAAKALGYLTSGYDTDIDQVVNGALFDTINRDMVVVTNIEYYSMCEHHMLPFFGVCHVGYLPGEKVIGLSKIPRIIDAYARRLQVQENLTRQIADEIVRQTGARGIGVVMEGQHLCMMMRGVEKQSSSTKTSVMLGLFRDNLSTRTEFLRLISL